MIRSAGHRTVSAGELCAAVIGVRLAAIAVRLRRSDALCGCAAGLWSSQGVVSACRATSSVQLAAPPEPRGRCKITGNALVAIGENTLIVAALVWTGELAPPGRYDAKQCGGPLQRDSQI